MRRLHIFTLLVCGLSASLLFASGGPEREFAEHLLNERATELRQANIHEIEAKTSVTYLDIRGDEIEKPKSAEKKEVWAYRIESNISPLQGDETRFRRVELAIFWKPNANIEQTQKVAQSFYIADKTE